MYLLYNLPYINHRTNVIVSIIIIPCRRNMSNILCVTVNPPPMLMLEMKQARAASDSTVFVGVYPATRGYNCIHLKGHLKSLLLYR